MRFRASPNSTRLAGQIRLVAVAGILLICGSGSAVAQQFDLFAHHAHSGQSSLEQSRGLGVGFSVDPVDWLRLGMGFVQSSSQSERDGHTCARLQPQPTWCQPDHLDEEVQIRSFRVLVLPATDLAAGLRAGLGIGFSTNELSAESVGRTDGRMGALYIPPSAHMGAFVRLEVAWTPIPWLPLGLTLGGTNHWIAFDGCRESPPMHAPFCGAGRFTEIQAGASLKIWH